MTTSIALVIVSFVLCFWFNFGITTAQQQHLHNVEVLDMTKVDIASTGRPLNQIIQSATEVMILKITNSSLLSHDWNLVQFKLKLHSNQTVFQVEILNQTRQIKGRYDEWHNLFKVTPNFGEIAYFDCDSELNQLKLEFETQIGFAIWDIVVDYKIEITPVDLKISDYLYGKDDLVTNYLIRNSTALLNNAAYINITLDDSDASSEYCFTVLISQVDTLLDVYLAVDGINPKQKLARITHENGYFCTTDLVYYRPLGHFTISFNAITSAKPMLNSADSVLVNVRCTKKHKNLRVLDYSESWWHNNPELFGYTVLSDSTLTLYACDMVANCYQYESGKSTSLISKYHKTVYNFSLSQHHQSLLAHSPVFRVFTDDVHSTIHADTPYLNRNKISLERIKSNLIKQSKSDCNAKFISTQKGFTHQSKSLPNTPGKPMRTLWPISTNSIDLRTQNLVLTYRTLTPNVTLQLLSVKYGQTTLLIKPIGNSPNELTISIADYLSIPRWKMASKSDEMLLVEYETMCPNSTGMYIDTQTDYSVTDLSDSSSNSTLSIHNLRTSYIPMDFHWNTTLDRTHNPRVYILSSWFPADTSLTLDHMDAKVQFKFVSQHIQLTNRSISVYRFVIGTQEDHYSPRTHLTNWQVNDTREASLVDEFTYNEEKRPIKLAGWFRIGYEVELREDFPVNLKVEGDFDELPQFDKKNCARQKKTYGDLNCLFEKSICPEYYFKQNSDSCLRAN